MTLHSHCLAAAPGRTWNPKGKYAFLIPVLLRCLALGTGCALGCPCPPPAPSLSLGAPVQPPWHTLGSLSHVKSCLIHWSRADHAFLPAICLAIFASNMMYGELCVSLSLPYDAVRSLSAFYIPSAYLTALIKYLLSYLCNDSEYYSLTRHLHI